MARSKPSISADRFVREGVLELRVDGLTAELGLASIVMALATTIAWFLAATMPGALPAGLLLPALLAVSIVGGWRSSVMAGVIAILARIFVLRGRPDPLFLGQSVSLANLALFILTVAALGAIGAYMRFLLDRLRQSRREMSERNIRYATLFEKVPEGFAVCDAIRDDRGRLVDYRIIEINPALQRLLAVGPEVIGSRLSQSPNDWTRWLRLCDRVLTTGEPVKFERFSREINRWHEVHLSRLSDSRIAQFFFDITHRKANEARQAELFDELNHRVKNNLAMVSSLLQLQARESDAAASIELEKAASRVRSIAEVHGALTRGAGPDSVDFAAYLEELCVGLRRSLAIDEGMALGVDAEPALISIDAAIPLGMVVNELVTNAIKYAYPPNAGGAISVGFRREDEELLLTVRDSGPGLPEDVDRRSGLGMRLVRSLVDQVGGKLTIHDEDGARFEIRLRNEAPPSAEA